MRPGGRLHRISNLPPPTAIRKKHYRIQKTANSVSNYDQKYSQGPEQALELRKPTVDINRITLVGRVGQAPEKRTTPNGVDVVKFSLATSRWAKENPKTDWHKVVWWKPPTIWENLKKGSRIYIEGEVNYRDYEDKSGGKVYMTEIIARVVLLLDKSDGDERNKGGQRSQTAGSGQNQRGGQRQLRQTPPPAQTPANSGGGSFNDNDDLPF